MPESAQPRIGAIHIRPGVRFGGRLTPLTPSAREPDRRAPRERPAPVDVDVVLCFAEPPFRIELRYALLLRSPTVYETLGARNAFKRLGCLLTNVVRWSVLKS